MTATTDRTAAPRPRVTLPQIFDCAENAWDEVGATGLGDFGRLYREDLDDAGRELIRPLLIAGWRKRGYRVRLLDATSINRMSPDPNVDPPNETYWQVWQEAADQIDYSALLTAADLEAEYEAQRKDES
jgi:hypothetical protein